MNSQELKAISLQLRSLVSRAVRSNSDDARTNIRRLLGFVNDTPILRAQVERAPAPAEDVAEMWQRTRNEGEHLAVPDNELEELGLLHAVLVELSSPSQEDFWQMCFMYGGVHDIKESVRAVLHDVALRYGDHLRRHLELELLASGDPAYGNRHVEIHLSGGNNQLNLAQDYARVEAAQSVGASLGDLVRAARELAVAAVQLGGPQAAEVEEAAIAIAETAGQPKPQRFTLRAAAEKLELLTRVTSSVAVLGPQAHHVVDLARAAVQALGG